MRPYKYFGILEAVSGVLLVLSGFFAFILGYIFLRLIHIFCFIMLFVSIKDFILYIKIDYKSKVFCILNIISIIMGIIPLLNIFWLLVCFPVWAAIHCIFEFYYLRFFKDFIGNMCYKMKIVINIIGFVLGFIMIFLALFSSIGFPVYISALYLFIIGISNLLFIGNMNVMID